MKGGVLVTGGTGKVGSRTASALREAGAEVSIATRHPTKAHEVAFDWSNHATFAASAGTEAMLVVAPPGAEDPLGTMAPGLTSALEHGVSRFVLIGASSIAMDGPLTGAVYRWIADHAPSWAILRPTWFMQNFSEGQHLPTIRDERTIYSATGSGRVPFIDAGDIGRVAARLLLSDEENGEVVVTGPEPLSYDEVAATLSDVLGVEVGHRHLDRAAMAARFERFGMPANFATALAAMDAEIATGSEDRVTDAVERILRREPTGFRDFAQQARSVWEAAGDV